MTGRTPSRIREKPAPLPNPALPGADFADCYARDLGHSSMTAEAFARAMIKDPPDWAQRLLILRNVMVRPFGLSGGKTDGNSVNGFPFMSCEDDQAVLGFDDKHLDFRIVIDMTGRGTEKARAHVTTLVRRHGLPGRLYLAGVLPFHRKIVPAMMRRVAVEG
ncbi:MAG: DUF2867 domain-containing protein [Pseudomonadota bacterium]